MSLDTNQLQQRSPEWEAWRRDKIGSSDAPTIMGINRYQTPFELYLEKKGLAEPRAVSYPMLRGTELEPKARDWYIQYTGIQMFPSIEVHAEHPYLIASMDGVNFSGTKALEIKCPMGGKPAEIERTGIPEEYICQVQHQMLVTGLTQVDLLVFDGVQGIIYPIVRDQEYIERLLAKELEFYSWLENDTPPTETAPIKNNTGTKYESIETPEWSKLAVALRESNTRLADEKAINDSLRERAKELSGGRSVSGFGMSLRVSSAKGAVDYSKVPELAGVDLEPYRKSNTTRITIDFSE